MKLILFSIFFILLSDMFTQARPPGETIYYTWVNYKLYKKYIVFLNSHNHVNNWQIFIKVFLFVFNDFFKCYN